MDNSQLPAYPIGLEGSLNVSTHNGFTKLEIMTMAAMQGLVNGLVVTGGIVGHGWEHNEIAEEAIKIGKATLSELTKQQ